MTLQPHCDRSISFRRRRVGHEEPCGCSRVCLLTFLPTAAPRGRSAGLEFGKRSKRFCLEPALYTTQPLRITVSEASTVLPFEINYSVDRLHVRPSSLI